ncbi:MAG: purine-nucleoside phosphorylase [Planctomycetaceae bacterium]|nr:purine-nucleoside phosphorylase [Planctomycetaceae bacterium]
MRDLQRQVNETLAMITARWKRSPRIGLICGSGLSRIIEPLRPEAVFSFDELPHFVPSTALGHAGKLICGEWHEMPVVAMQGRLHFYEGYTLAEITYPIRVMKSLGVEILIVTSASGGMNPQHRPGQIIVLDDHINMMGDNPLAGWNDDELGPRYPDMSQPYDVELSNRAIEIARQRGIVLQKGIYVGVKGPNYETRAEYRFFRMMGADVVGMSTVPETLVAVHAGMRVVGLSTITNVCLPDALSPTSGQQVIDVAHKAASQVRQIIDGLIQTESRNYHSELFRD